MKIAGIIAEYNPFHGGHAYQIEQTRKAGASHIVAVMSGNYVQRGEPAFLEKHARAEMALHGGADLVLELPVPWSCARAQDFARAGVSLLHAMGCVELLSFGSECGSTALLCETAQALESPEMRDCLRGCLDEGMSLPAAREKAAAQCLGKEAAALLQGANDALAFEYLRALKSLHSPIRPLAVLRKGARHDETGCAEGFPSAAQIRSLILQDNPPRGKKASPPSLFEILRREITAGRAPVSYSAMETAILSHLRRLSPADLALLPDISEGLEYRLYEGIRSACSLGSLFSCVKTKRYTHARIRRLTLHAFLGVTRGDTALSPPYLHVLGFNDRGQEVLRRMRDTAKKPVLMRASGLRTLSPRRANDLPVERVRNGSFSPLPCRKKQPCGMEQTKNVVRLSSTG